MELTPEQRAIIASTGDIRINAVAGSGKTTTVLEYARARPADAPILYLAFNKTVREEAKRRLGALGLTNVQVETAHSLAYRHTMQGRRHLLLDNGRNYKAHELADVLRLHRPDGQTPHGEYVLASHIGKFFTYYCNSDKERVSELNYLDTVGDAKARGFVERHRDLIEDNCRRLLKLMYDGHISLVHDFYLKLFQRGAPVLPHRYLIFDEGQDASAVMLDVFFRQTGTKAIVGDAHQQIYGWRHAVNSLEQADFALYPLSTSFRFGPPIAELANHVLGWKETLGAPAPLALTGAAAPALGTTKAVLGRTNLALLVQAIEYLTQCPSEVERVYFEGNINSYAYAESGAGLSDVLALYNGRSAQIRDPLIRRMANLNELQEYAEQTEDGQLLVLINIVEEYGNDIYRLINELRRRHVTDGARDQAQICFSTVHRSKGLEYDAVQLTSDFITRAGVEQAAKEYAARPPDAVTRGKLMEEINMLYVALTRTKRALHYPAGSWPVGLTPGQGIQLTNGTGGTWLAAPPPPTPADSGAQATYRRYEPPALPVPPGLARLQSKLDEI